MVDKLIEFIKNGEHLLNHPEMWKSLNIDYYPPTVHRLYIDYEGYRYYLHQIFHTDEPCLFHKHRWPSAIYIVAGQYEMGVAYSEQEISSDEAYDLPIAAKVFLTAGSYYEMTETHGLHYVKPISLSSLSIMVSGPLYKEDRKEALDRKLEILDEDTKKGLLYAFQVNWPKMY